MPITLPPISRRRFIQGSLAAAGALALGCHGHSNKLTTTMAADASVAGQDLNHVALLSDIHINAEKTFVSKQGVNMWDHLTQVSDEVIALKERPGVVLVNGDCAFNAGRAVDYATVIEGLRPMRQAGFPMHLALGNHDSREHLLAAVGVDAAQVTGAGETAGVERRVMRVELPRVDWYMLDSLDKTLSTPGLLGPEQLAWLGKTLDAHPDRAAVVMMHHQPNRFEKDHGLIDTAAFVEIVQSRKQVKAVLYGHTHEWTYHVTDGLHFVNLPTSAYVFKPMQPAGWVDARLGESGMKLTLNTIAKTHPKNGEVLDLKWRA